MLVFNNGIGRSSMGIFLPDAITEGVIFEFDGVTGRPFGLSELVIPVEGISDVVFGVVSGEVVETSLLKPMGVGPIPAACRTFNTVSRGRANAPEPQSTGQILPYEENASATSKSGYSWQNQ